MRIEKIVVAICFGIISADVALAQDVTTQPASIDAKAVASDKAEDKAENPEKKDPNLIRSDWQKLTWELADVHREHNSAATCLVVEEALRRFDYVESRWLMEDGRYLTTLAHKPQPIASAPVAERAVIPHQDRFGVHKCFTALTEEEQRDASRRLNLPVENMAERAKRQEQLQRKILDLTIQGKASPRIQIYPDGRIEFIVVMLGHD